MLLSEPRGLVLAKFFARSGAMVIPVDVHDVYCVKSNKSTLHLEPLVKLEDASRSVEQFNYWWECWPAAMPALRYSQSFHGMLIPAVCFEADQLQQHATR